MNNLVLVGNVTKDLELKETTGGIKYSQFGIAVNRRDKDKTTDFFNVTVWREQAENCAKYLRKGSKVGIVGSLQTRSVEIGERKITVTEINVREVEFLSTRAETQSEPTEPGRATKKPTLTEVDDDDKLPF